MKKPTQNFLSMDLKLHNRYYHNEQFEQDIHTINMFFPFLIVKENLSWPSFRRRNGEFFGLPPLWHFHRVLAGREHNNEDACKLDTYSRSFNNLQL